MRESVSAGLLLTLLIGIAMHSPATVTAQDDPFAGGNNILVPAVRPAPAAAVDPDGEKEVITDPTIRSIIESNPQTPEALLRAIDVLLDLDREDLAIAFVDQLAARTLDDSAWFDLYRKGGPDKIIRLGLQPGLGEAGTMLSRKIIDGARRFATGDGRIEQLLDRILSEDTFDRSRALDELRLLGDAGAAALIEMLIREDRKADWPRIRTAIKHFGKTAEGPLVAAWNSNSAKLRVEALQALGHVNSNESIETLLGPAMNEPESSINRVVAARSIQNLLGYVPDDLESSQVLYRSGRDHLLGFVPGKIDEYEARWWHWDTEQRKLVPSWMTTETISRIRGFRRARDLATRHPEREDYQRLYWVARLETSKMAGGSKLGLPSTVLDGFAREIDGPFINLVLGDALDLNLFPAAIGACELMAVRGDSSLLYSTGGANSPLVRALNAGSVRLTNAACQTIGKLDPDQSFAGSSQYIDSLVYLSRSVGLKSALAGHINRETAQTLATMAAASGYSSSAVTSARELFEAASTNPDLQLILMTDVLGRPGYSELLQALRDCPRTRRVPVMLLVNPDQLDSAQRLAERFPNVLATPMIRDEKFLARQIANLLMNSSFDEADDVERLGFAHQSLDLLAQYAEQPERYAFYDLNRYGSDLTRLLALPSSAFQGCRLLGRIGTAEAQTNLVNTASNVQLPESLRRAAAESFSQAVKSRGLMLDRQAILAQYDRYNASEKEAPEAQLILGYLLDAIEGRLQ